MRLNLSDLLTKDPPPPDWLIGDLIHKQQFAIVAGDAGAGKSFFWYTASFGIALGQPFIGRVCAPGSVLYFDDENSIPDLTDYLIKIWWAYGCPDPSVIAQRLHIEHFTLSRAGDAWPEHMGARIAEIKPALIVVDTATSALGVQDENDNAEASRIVRHLRRCVSQGDANASLLVMKHAKDGRVRGAKAWEGMADQVLVQAKFKGRADGLHNTKLESTKRRSFGLRHPIKIMPQISGHALKLNSEPLQVKQKKRS